MYLAILQPNPNRSRSIYERRVRCRLHGHPIVDELPRRCPFQAAKPTEALWAMKDLAWSATGHSRDNGGQFSEGIHLQERCDVCYGCVAANLGHPTIQRIRRASGVAR